MATGLEKDISIEIFEELTQIGYSFGRELGRGGFSAAYHCVRTNENNVVEHIAVRHIDFTKIHKYSPEFLWQTDNQRKEYQNKY
jgi:hypothetical protein